MLKILDPVNKTQLDSVPKSTNSGLKWIQVRRYVHLNLEITEKNSQKYTDTPNQELELFEHNLRNYLDGVNLWEIILEISEDQVAEW